MNLSKLLSSSAARLGWRRAPALALAASAALLPSGSLRAQPPEMVQNVEVGALREIELFEKLEFTGSLDAWEAINVSSKARAQIIAMPVEEGSAVKKGDLLFELDGRTEQIALQKSQAELEKAKIDFKKLTAGYLPDEIDAMRKAVAAAEAKLNAAKDEWERLKPLAETEVVSARQANVVQAALKVAESEYAQAKSRANLIEQGFRSEEVQMAHAEVKAREAGIADIERQLSDLKTVATENGVITRRLRVSGEWASEGEPVLEMVVLDQMRLRIEVPQAHIGKIRPGLAATMRVDGLGNESFTAQIRNIIPQARTGTRNFPVLLTVDNADRKLAAGMFARVELQTGAARKVLVVPREAVQFRGLKLAVYRADELPKDFVYTPPEPPPMKGKRGAPAKPRPPAHPDRIAREIEIQITDELETEVVVEPKVAGQLWADCEIVILGASKLREGSLMQRLAAPLPGAG